MYMKNLPESVINLIHSAEEMCICKYILAEAKATNFLINVAMDIKCYTFFKNMLIDYDYKGTYSEFNLNVINQWSDEKLLCFVFCLLVDINLQRFSLNDFLNHFYGQREENEQYDEFVRSLLQPFYKALCDNKSKIERMKVEIS